MTQNRLPAPYELNNAPSPMAASPQYLARGGRTGRSRMIKVHMNPHELQILDHLQGKAEYGPNGIKRYPGLEDLLKNHHIVQNVHHHARQHHAQGGLTPAMEHLRAGGRFGDTQLAEIGPHTHGLFNELAGHPTRNPYTGHPEYFSLGGALSGLWNTIKGAGSGLLNTVKGVGSSLLGGLTGGGGASDALKGIAQAAAPTLLPMAQQALGNRFGDMGQMAGNMLSQGAQSYLGQPSENSNPYYSAIGQSLGKAAQGYGSGMGASQAFGQGLQNFGSQMGGGFGNALSDAGQSLGQGNSWRNAARAGAQRGYNELGGRQGLYNAAGNIGQGLMRGGFGGAQHAARGQMGQYMNKFLPQPANQDYMVPQESYEPQEEYGYPMYG